MYIFLFFSFLSGMLELGSVYIGIRLKLSIIWILLLPLSYQVGNLMMNFKSRKEYRTLCIVFITGVLSLFQFAYNQAWIIAVQIALSSYCIQDIRSRYKVKCPTWMKRCFRIGGFLAAPIMLVLNGELGIIICVSSSIIALLINHHTNQNSVSANGKRKQFINKLSFVMIFHQLHYFVYTYIMPIYIFRYTNSIWCTTIMFALTWIVYLIPQTVIERYESVDLRKVFLACHTFLAICMAGISLSIYLNNIVMVSLFWMLTGLGGGSVFCIRHLSPIYQKIDMDISENIGHLLGPLIAISICSIDSENAAVLLPAVSCLFVIIAIVIALKGGQ